MDRMASKKLILFTPYQMGEYLLKNRIVMPPMTRSRAGGSERATDMMATYYGQRATAGLIISEGAQISQQGRGYAWTPGIYSAEQVESWKAVTKAVHDKGGVIFAQLWHVGRISHTSLQPGNQAPVSASALKAEGVNVFVDTNNAGAEQGKAQTVSASEPRALETPEIASIVQDYGNAARNAIDAGFDGIEIHAANGYLLNQFIDSQSNQRTDQYGGSVENRLRFLKEVVEAVVAEIGKDKVGVRLAPFTTLNGTVDDDPQNTYIEAAKMLNESGIVYLHIAEADWDNAPETPESFRKELRAAFKQTLIYAGFYTKEKAEHALEKGWCDLIGFGRQFIANPDLPYRLENDLPLNESDRSTYFGGGAKGYIDYPAYQELHDPTLKNVLE